MRCYSLDTLDVTQTLSCSAVERDASRTAMARAPWRIVVWRPCQPPSRCARQPSRCCAITLDREELPDDLHSEITCSKIDSAVGVNTTRYSPEENPAETAWSYIAAPARTRGNRHPPPRRSSRKTRSPRPARTEPRPPQGSSPSRRASRRMTSGGSLRARLRYRCESSSRSSLAPASTRSHDSPPHARRP